MSAVQDAIALQAEAKRLRGTLRLARKLHREDQVEIARLRAVLKAIAENRVKGADGEFVEASTPAEMSVLWSTARRLAAEALGHSE